MHTNVHCHWRCVPSHLTVAQKQNMLHQSAEDPEGSLHIYFHTSTFNKLLKYTGEEDACTAVKSCALWHESNNN